MGQLEKSQDMLLSFQQDLNLTESELKRANEENRRLREETTLTPDKSILDSKEKQIRKLNDSIKNLEVEYDTLLQTKDKEKMRADKLDREKQPLSSKIEQLEADLKHALKMSDSKENNLSKDIAMFNQEISRLTKERDTTKTELDVCKHDLRKLEIDLKSSRDETTRLLSDKDKMTNGLEKGQREV